MANRYKKKHGFIFKGFKNIFKLFKKKPTIINRNETFPNQALFVSNHSAASGPMILSLYFPVYFIPWGAHQMTGNYKARWNYLYYIFYQKKLGYSKFKSFIISTLFAIISKLLYNAMKLIPTYEDPRLIKTFRMSKEAINNNRSLLIFPEDSNSGYHEYLLKYNPGFIAFVQYYYRKTKLDLPIYPIYFHKKLNAMIIDKPIFIQPLLAEGKSREEIAEYFRDVTNELGRELIEALAKLEK
ncbi:MAG: hypothetical protein WC964_02555 [Acholeplasmataceae bacterium]